MNTLKKKAVYLWFLTSIGFCAEIHAETPTPDVTDAARLESLQKASAEGSVSAMVELAKIHLTGADELRDPQMAVALYQRAASLGDADANFNLGNMYLMGDGVPRDDDKAYEYFSQAAGQGHPLAIQNLESLRRLTNDGDANDPPLQAEPEPLERVPATLDEISAIQLARRHGIEIDFSGTHDPTSSKQGISVHSNELPREDDRKPLKESAPVDAQRLFQQAEQLYFGDGTAKDEAKAITLYRSAARAGHVQATSRLLAIYAAAGIEPPRCGSLNVADEICF